jgi:hypothetical protein
MNSKILALSKTSEPGRFDRTMGRDTRPLGRLRRFFNSCSTLRRINSWTERPSLAALPLSRGKGNPEYRPWFSRFDTAVFMAWMYRSLHGTGLRVRQVEREILRYA